MVTWICKRLAAFFERQAFMLSQADPQLYKTKESTFSFGHIHVHVDEMLDSDAARVDCTMNITDIVGFCVGNGLDHRTGDRGDAVVIVGALGIVDGYDRLRNALNSGRKTCPVTFYELRNVREFVEDAMHPHRNGMVDELSWVYKWHIAKSPKMSRLSQPEPQDGKIVQLNPSNTLVERRWGR